MIAPNNTRLVQQLYDAFNRRDFDIAASVVTDDCELVNMALGSTFRGKEGVKQFQQGWATAFPDGKVTITSLMATDEAVTVEYTGRGTHTGPLAGPAGTLPATGKPLVLYLCDVHQITNGKISSSHTYYDALGLLQQLGLAPA
jgi:steroid delta-isomerase-like uncharacterized protein